MSDHSSPAASLDRWQDWPVDQKLRFRAVLRRRVLDERARADQSAPPAPWQKFFLSGGRGSGKTWAGAKAFADEIMADAQRSEGAWAIVAPTFADARDKCVESEESGLLVALGTSLAEVKAGVSPVVEKWNRSIGELVFHDGTRVVIDGADDGAYRIQGENLRGCWCDEIGLWKKWRIAWEESITFALRLGNSRIIATGTPKRSLPARALVQRLLADPACVSRRLRTVDNLDNLSDAFKAAAVEPYLGTTLGAQELEGRLLENAEGALWELDWIERTRVTEVPYGGWQRPPVIGVDPSDGTADGAEHAYTVVGHSMHDHDLYVVESEGLRVSPTAFAREVVLVCERHHGIIVVEKNHGGQWLVEVFRQAMQDLGVMVPLRTVSASQNKRTRAEPIAALYEPRGETPGRVHHVGYFEALEDQMVNFTGAAGEVSPDRLDSLVWALSQFTGYRFGPSLPDEHDQAVPYTDVVHGSDYAGELDGAVPWR